jgi:hypothetical protein
MIDITMGTNCAPLLANLFLHACEADLFLKNEDRKLSQIVNSIFRCIDDVLSLNISRLGDYLHRIYQSSHEVNDTTDTKLSTSYLDYDTEED